MAVTTFSTASRARLGAPAVRPAGRIAAVSACHRGECVTGSTGATTRPERDERWGYRRLGGGGLPRPARAEALRARRRRRWLPRTRRPAAPAATPHRCRACGIGPAVLRAGHPLTVQDHRQGRALRRVADAMAQAPPLTVIFPGKTSAPIGRTGQTEVRPHIGAGQASLDGVCPAAPAPDHRATASLMPKTGNPAT